LQNGYPILERHFSSVSTRLFHNALRVTEAEGIIQYLLTFIGFKHYETFADPAMLAERVNDNETVF
jgi:hypothetical protein